MGFGGVISPVKYSSFPFPLTNIDTKDSSLFLQRTSKGIVVLLVYVDDIVVTGFDMEAISKIHNLLHSTFHMKDLGQLTYFLGLEVHHWPQGIFLNKHKYIMDLIQLVGLTKTTSVDTSMGRR